ncbi:MAG: sigma-54-dependent Fis family transcriptional regulator [Alphaproteobacteria bacterium]|nr:sigma-54-dependent Fis family transcriptional regulator [Alphaproteobacteria bacterium]
MADEILVIDDEDDIRSLIADILEDEGYKCRTASNSDGALAAVAERRPDLLILDIWLEGSTLDGMEILERVYTDYEGIPVVMISGHGNVETAVNAIKLGAYDFIEKPFKADRLILTVKRALETSQLQKENERLRKRTGEVTEVVGASAVMKQLRGALERVAPTDSRVLISGPPGVGKEVFARQLMEIELFGEESDDPDAAPKIGTLEQADRGTLLLDEVSDMPLETQGKIVRVLQEQTFTRVGGDDPVEVDVRVIASTNHDMEAEMSAGNFRQDLYYRLNVVPIEILPLRDRPDDIPALIDHFMDRSVSMTGVSPRVISLEAMAALQAYDWPGNVRQLRNAVDWILIMAPGGPDEPVGVDNLPPDIGTGAAASVGFEDGAKMMSLPLREARENFERQYLLAQVSRFGGNVSRTAEFIGMERSALHRKLKTLGVTNREIAERAGETVSDPAEQ